jgi:hypothetical protein
MKRNETPLNASIILDALCSPITLTGNYALPAQSYHWLRKNFSVKPQPHALLNLFIPALQSLPGFNNMLENRDARNCAHLNPLNKKYKNIHTDNKTTDIITYR